VIDSSLTPPPTGFIETVEYLRFAEFCDACRQSRYIGLCYGVPGVGKTVSARHYSHWDEFESLVGPPPHRISGIPRAESGPWRTMLYTPGVTNTPRIIEREIDAIWAAVFGLASRLHERSERRPRAEPPALVIVDEADRLKTAGLEQLRDMYDRRTIGLVLIGMPGLQKRLARYAQLYSRVGFVHQFLPLGGAELQHVIQRQSQQLGLGLELYNGTDTSVLSSIVRITGGNFRLVERLFAQIERVAQINEMATLTPELVEAAQESLVIGAS
jgi:DNA transposition AAA+ family ATPase